MEVPLNTRLWSRSRLVARRLNTNRRREAVAPLGLHRP